MSSYTIYVINADMSKSPIATYNASTYSQDQVISIINNMDNQITFSLEYNNGIYTQVIF